MTHVGIDTHKASLAACAVDAVGRPLAERTFDNDRAGHAALAAWLEGLEPVARVGLEGSASFGVAAARHLAAAGHVVREVPPALSHRERGRSRRAGKSDPGDALAIARVVAREEDLPPVRSTGVVEDIALLVSARDALVAEATRVRNRVHALLRTIEPGYHASAARLTRAKHRAIVRTLLRTRRGVAVELVRDGLDELARLERRVARHEARLEALVGDHPLRRHPGIGLLTAATLIGRAGDPGRFRDDGAFARLAGVAPIPASSGQVQRMRYARGGDRQLNRALYVIAVAQVWNHPPARAYLERKRAEGKSWREAMRCLKRRIARPVLALLVEGHPALTARDRGVLTV
jgi:transposase